MIRYYCDVCNKEIPTESAGKRLKRRYRRNEVEVEAEVMLTVNRTVNAGHICNECVVLVVTEGADIR